MRGLIVDYCGVLDGPEEDQARWRSLLSAARNNGVATAVLSNDPGGPGAEPIRELEYHGIVESPQTPLTCPCETVSWLMTQY